MSIIQRLLMGWAENNKLEVRGIKGAIPTL
jgi:hypothetical protein